MKIAVDMNYKEYIRRLRERFDSPLLFGQERFTGWCIGRIFSVKYSSGKELGRRYYPIANKAMGIVQRNDEKAVVSYYNFRGLTDPISFALIFFLTTFIFLIIDAIFPALFGLGWTIAVALHTWACSAFSAAGQEGKVKLDHLLSHSMTNM